MIRIIDCGSQLTQNIARRVREQGVFTGIVPFNTDISGINAGDLEAIIVSGGQFSVYDPGSPKYTREALELGKPVLGICYGLQSMAYLLGGKVEKASNREYGKMKIRLERKSPIFKGIEKEFDVWMSHGDIVTEMPEGFEVVARSDTGHIAAMQNIEKGLFAVQFHPEVDHTQHGREILQNFIDYSNAQRTWKPGNMADTIIGDIREKVKYGEVIAGVSGGVDSMTLAVLMHRALGDRFYAVFVDNGVLRKNEGEEVRKAIGERGVNLVYVDAAERFLEKLAGEADPTKKRKIIGNEFIYVFEEEARKLQGVKYLGQGTLYPDVIESVPIYGASSVIKAHHNVGGLPEKMNLGLIEPFRALFKDEVRAIAESLGLPKEVVWRHPFPGPGLAVRCIGMDVTKERLEILREADAIYMEELMNAGVYYDISQAFAVLTNVKSVGVMGDEHSYDHVIGLRAVNTGDFMTAKIYRFDWDILEKITSRIGNEVRGVNRVVYDTTQKPPATIVWE